MKQRLWIIFFVVAYHGVWGQVLSDHDNARMELPLKLGQMKPELLPLGARGFLLFEEENTAFSSEKTINLTKYDTAFQLSWKKNVKYNKRLRLKMYEYQDGAVFMIFNDESKEELQVARIGLNGNVEIHNFFYLKRLEIKDFIVRNDKAYLAGILKRLPVVLQMDLSKNRIKPMPMAFSTRSATIEELTFAGSEAITATVLAEQDRKKSAIIRTVGVKGGQVEDLKLIPERNHGILSAKITALSPQEQVVIGTYAIKNEESAQGFYIGKYAGGKVEYVKYHSFVDLNNFFSFLEEKDQARIAQKVERKQEKGKILKVKYRLLMHDVINRNGEYIMVGEAYYPVYRTERVNDIYGRRGFSTTRVVFDGYQYTHAVVAVFDNTGNLQWDNSFKIDDTRAIELKERVKVQLDGDEVVLIYNLEGQINKQIVTREKVVAENETVAKSQFDNIKDADLGESEYWFGRNFIAWGYQKIKNKSEEVDKKRRRVFYINKLAF